MIRKVPASSAPRVTCNIPEAIPDMSDLPDVLADIYNLLNALADTYEGPDVLADMICRG